MPTRFLRWFIVKSISICIFYFFRLLRVRKRQNIQPILRRMAQKSIPKCSSLFLRAFTRFPGLDLNLNHHPHPETSMPINCGSVEQKRHKSQIHIIKTWHQGGWCQRGHHLRGGRYPCVLCLVHLLSQNLFWVSLNF